MFDGKALGEQLTVVVRDYVSRATQGLRENVESIQRKLAEWDDPRLEIDRRVREAIAAIPPVAPPVIDHELIESHVHRAMSAIPVPKDGVDGKDAAPVDLDAVVAKVLPLVPVKEGPAGRDGRDVSVEDIAVLVRAAVAEIPKPKDGEPGRDGKCGADAVIDYDLVIGEVVKRIPAPKDGTNGVNGKDADPVDIELIAALVHSRIQVPKDGVNGKDAEVDYDRITTEIAKAIKELPPAKDGIDGRDADPVDYPAILTHIDGHIDARIKGIEIPQPKDGRDGVDAAPVDYMRLFGYIDERVAKIPVPKDGQNGRDGKDVDPAQLEALTVRAAEMFGEKLLERLNA